MVIVTVSTQATVADPVVTRYTFSSTDDLTPDAQGYIIDAVRECLEVR